MVVLGRFRVLGWFWSDSGVVLMLFWGGPGWFCLVLGGSGVVWLFCPAHPSPIAKFGRMFAKVMLSGVTYNEFKETVTLREEKLVAIVTVQ